MTALHGTIGVIVDAIKALTVALLPVFLALGMLANPIGLVLAMQFLMLAMLLIMVIVQVLDVIQDPFSYYDGDAPTERGPEWTTEELEDAGNGHPETPEETCAFGSQSVPSSVLAQAIVAAGGVASTINSMLRCASNADASATGE